MATKQIWSLCLCGPNLFTKRENTVTWEEWKPSSLIKIADDHENVFITVVYDREQLPTDKHFLIATSTTVEHGKY